MSKFSEDFRQHFYSGIQSTLQWLADHKRKIAGVIFIVMGAVGMWSWILLPAGIFFVVVGVSLIFDVQLWRR
jgi:hypothetical protein